MVLQKEFSNIVKIYFMDSVITLRVSKELKKAIRAAAIEVGYDNTSQFILSIMGNHKQVKKELSKKAKKDLAVS